MKVYDTFVAEVLEKEDDWFDDLFETIRKGDVYRIEKHGSGNSAQLWVYTEHSGTYICKLTGSGEWYIDVRSTD